ncbi:MAG TPA: hypothetical protein VGF45_12980, partial [Polyangia bacterium]
AAGCEKTEGPRPGAPVLVSLDVFDASGMPVALTADGGPVLVPPRSHVVALFDRLLDGSRLESVTDAGTSGKPGVVALAATGGAAQPQASLVYVPNGDTKFRLLFAPGPQLVVTPVPTLPAGASISLTLDKTQLVSKRGEGPCTTAPGVPDVLTFTTAPFAAVIEPGPPPPMSMPAPGSPLPLAANAPLTIVFNNLPEAAIADRIVVTVTDSAGQTLVDGAAPAVPSEMDPATLLVLPKTGAWPAGARVAVTVNATAKDALGMPIAAAAVETFVVGP